MPPSSRPFQVIRAHCTVLAPLLAALLAMSRPAGAADADAAAPAFDVLEYRVSGNTLLPPRVIEAAVYPYLGPGKTIADVESARRATEEAYREAGFPTVFVDIPEQDVSSSGLVRLAVTEGRIQRVRVTGSRYFSNGWIREQVPEATAGNIPRLAEFQAQIQAANARSADRSVDPILRPGSEPGTVEVELKVRDELPLHGSLEVNNRSTANTTATRVNAAARYDNLWQREHSLSLQYQVAPEDPDESEVLAMSYLAKPEGSGNSYVFYAVDSDSDVATLGGDISVQGPGNVFGSRAVLPLPSGDGFFHSLSLGADYKDFEETIGFADEDEDDIRTPISYLAWAVAWNGTLLNERRVHNFSLGLTFGLRGLVNDATEFEDKRFKARPSFSYVTGGYSVVQQLPRDLSLYWNLGIQLAAQPLVSNEQFNAGGLDSVRGYYESEELGDYGARTNLELRSPNFGPRLLDGLDSLQLFVFADAAVLGIHDALPGQDDGTGIWSTGIGARLAGGGIVAGLDWALPLRDASTTQEGDDRLLFQLQYGF